MRQLNFIAIIFLMLSILINICFDVNPQIIGSLSLKNIALYLLIFSIIIQKIVKKNHEDNQDNKIIFFVCLYVVYSFILMIFKTGNFENFSSLYENIYSFKGAFDPFVIFILILCLDLEKKSIQLILNILLVVFFLLNTITVCDSLALIEFTRIGFDDVYGRTSGAFGESNVYASYVSFFLPLLIGKILTSKKINNIIYMSINLFVGIFALILTGSRGGFVSAIISNMILIIMLKRCTTNISKNVLIYALTLLSITTFIVIYSMPLISRGGLEKNIVSRYESSDLDEYSSGRIGLWKKGLSIVLKNPFLGSTKPFSEMVGSNTHNTFLEITVSRGIIGLCFFVMIFYTIGKKMFFAATSKININAFFYFSGIVSFVISMLFLNMFSAYYYFFIYLAVSIKDVQFSCLCDLRVSDGENSSVVNINNCLEMS